jgi:CelD/BcsL family acetyltransferase involved in cellulose biosynthesis
MSGGGGKLSALPLVDEAQLMDHVRLSGFCHQGPDDRSSGRYTPQADIPVWGLDGARCELLQEEIAFRVETIGALDALEREWRLLEREAVPSFFLTWIWVGTLLEMIPTEARPLLMRGTAAGRTVALAMLGTTQTRRRGIIRTRPWVLNATGDPALDCVCIEHNGFLAAQAVGWEGLLEAFACAGEVDELSLPGIATPPPAELVEGRGLLRHERPVPSFAVELAATRGDVAAILSSNARSQLRRAMRRLEPLTLEVATSEIEALAFFDTLKELHIPWWERRGQPHSFVEPFFERFHRRLIERGFAAGVIQLLRLRSADRTLGVLYNFRHGGRIYAYQSGFIEPEAKERPGVIAHALAMERAWQEGAEIYDFMAGDNRLKRSFANRTGTLYWTVVQQPRLRFRAEHLARRLRARYIAARDGSRGGEQPLREGRAVETQASS